MRVRNVHTNEEMKKRKKIAALPCSGLRVSWTYAYAGKLRGTDDQPGRVLRVDTASLQNTTTGQGLNTLLVVYSCRVRVER